MRLVLYSFAWIMVLWWLFRRGLDVIWSHSLAGGRACVQSLHTILLAADDSGWSGFSGFLELPGWRHQSEPEVGRYCLQPQVSTTTIGLQSLYNCLIITGSRRIQSWTSPSPLIRVAAHASSSPR